METTSCLRIVSSGQFNRQLNKPEKVLSELKSFKPVVSSLVTTCVEGKEEEPSLDNLINLENFSSLTKLLRVTVLVVLFIEKLKKTRSREGTEEDFTKLYDKQRCCGLGQFSKRS